MSPGPISAAHECATVLPEEASRWYRRTLALADDIDAVRTFSVSYGKISNHGTARSFALSVFCYVVELLNDLVAKAGPAAGGHHVSTIRSTTEARGSVSFPSFACACEASVD